MNVIDAISVAKSYGPRQILDNATFSVGEEEKIGLIGVNGSGKSTLLRILARLEDRDGGTISTKRGARIGFLSQEPLLDDNLTVGEEIERGLTEIRRVMAEYEDIVLQLAADPAGSERLLVRQGELSGWIEHHGGWNTDYRINEIMGHLGLPDRNQQVGRLSGGTKRRVALAKLLLEAPDLLLLDEPTNHLDADTTEWLQEYLCRYPGAVLLITHDRYFLDKVATRMLELERGALTSYPGGYSAYLELKEAQLEHEARAGSRLLNLLRIETAWIRRGAKARTTKQKARIDRYSNLKEQAVPVSRREAKLEFATDRELGGTVLELVDIKKSYGAPLMNGLTLGMKRGQRIGIIGANGCGKTTLLRMITGEESPDSGSVVVGKKTRIAYFDQQRAMLEPEMMLYDFLGEGDYVLSGGEKRHKIGYLEDFLFPASDRMRKIGTLSGGEKSRLILARLMLEEANLLILDEPTNDLDIPTLQLLDAALAEFSGCVLVVTHDRFFLDKAATGILSFEGEGKVVFYEGNYTTYRELRQQPVAAAPAQAKRPAAVPQAQLPKPRRGLTYAERLELEKLEILIGGLEERKSEVERMLGDAGSYAGYPGGIQALSNDYTELERELATRYSRWEELEFKKEGG